MTRAILSSLHLHSTGCSDEGIDTPSTPRTPSGFYCLYRKLGGGFGPRPFRSTCRCSLAAKAAVSKTVIVGSSPTTFATPLIAKLTALLCADALEPNPF